MVPTKSRHTVQEYARFPEFLIVKCSIPSHTTSCSVVERIRIHELNATSEDARNVNWFQYAVFAA